MEGPGRAASGRPTLQTSSNHRNSNRLARTPVTNVVNLSPKTSIFSEKADGLTTFVTTGQKSTRKTPRIDDVCNNTQRSAPKSQHDKPDHIGGPEGLAAVPVGGGRAWPDFEPTRRAAKQRPGPTVVEGAGGSGGHGRASRRRAERSSQRGRLAGGQATRRPEICRGTATPKIRQTGPYSPPPPGSGRPV